MSATLVTPKTASGGEIIRELVNSSDGQGLHFDGASSHISIANSAGAEFGTSDFSLEFILNQTQASNNETYYFTAPYTGDNRMGFWYDKTNTTLKIYFRTSSNTHYDFGYDIAADFGSPTHFVVSADRDGNATLYKNGNSVGSVDISGSSAVNIGDSNANPFHISTNSANTAIIGSLYRFRTWNKALTQAEVDNAYQRADVPFESQYGSETDLVNANSSGSGTAWTGATGTTAPTGWSPAGSSRTYTIDAGTGDPAPSLKIEAGAANVGIKWGSAATLGKKHRVTFSYKCGDGATTMAYRLNDADSFVNLANSTSWVTTTVEWTGDGVTGGFMLRVNESGKFGHVDTVSIRAIGAVTDYDLAFSNPLQSLMIQDRAGVADGTASAGVSQTQKIVQLNATAISVSQATARTPSDGAIVADKVGIGVASPSQLVEAYQVGNAGNDYFEGAVKIGGASASLGGFVGYNSSNSGSVNITSLNNSGGANGKIQLGFGAAVDGTPATTVMSLNQAGLVGVNQGAPVQQMQVTGNGSGSTAIDSHGYGLRVSDENHAHGAVDVVSSGDVAQFIARSNVQGSFSFKSYASSGTSLVERMSIDSAGQVGLSATPNFGGANANNTILTLQGKAAAYGGIIELVNHGTSGNDQTLGSIGYFDPTTSVTKNAEIEVLRESAADDAYMVFKTKATGGTIAERLRISSAGLVSIGDVTATKLLHLKSADPVIRLEDSDPDGVYSEIDGAGGDLIISCDGGNGAANSNILFKVDGSTKVDINSAGNVLIGTTAVPSASVAGFCITGTNSGNLSSSGSATTAYNHLMFYNGNGNVGYIGTSGTSTSYSTSSDYRLKENLTPLTGALDRIEQLPVYRFNFKADADTTVDGFVAHEAQAIVPESVTGEKDAMKTVVVQEAVEAVEYQPAIEAVEYQAATYYEESDELPDGKLIGDIKTEEIQAVQGQPEIEAVEAKEEVTEEQPDMQGIDQSKLVPLLVAAVKELKAEIDALKNA